MTLLYDDIFTFLVKKIKNKKEFFVNTAMPIGSLLSFFLPMISTTTCMSPKIMVFLVFVAKF